MQAKNRGSGSRRRPNSQNFRKRSREIDLPALLLLQNAPVG